MKLILDMDAVVRDFSLKTASMDNKHYRHGWIHLCCPFCGDSKFHLGFHIQWSFFNCFKCGRLPVRDTIARLINEPDSSIKRVLGPYWKPVSLSPQLRGEQLEHVSRPLSYVVPMPIGCGLMKDQHKRYLEKRDYNPDKLEEEWGLLGTGPVGSMKLRIILPVVVQGRMVSYQGRDITNKATAKYLFCPDEEAVIPVKHCLYGIDAAQWASVVVVEGAPSVWRLGPGAVGTFGTQYTEQQREALSRFSKRIICFDSDEAGHRAAERLAADLDLFGGETSIASLSDGIKDPGLLKDDEAEDFMRSCGIG